MTAWSRRTSHSILPPRLLTAATEREKLNLGEHTSRLSKALTRCSQSSVDLRTRTGFFFQAAVGAVTVGHAHRMRLGLHAGVPPLPYFHRAVKEAHGVVSQVYLQHRRAAGPLLPLGGVYAHRSIHPEMDPKEKKPKGRKGNSAGLILH